MSTNKQAMSKIRKAINVLQDILFTDELSEIQRKRVKFSLSLLYDAYNDAADLPHNSSYADAAGALKAASNRLKAIKEEREQLANNLAKAGKISGVVNGVLGLLG